jgi:hypothetical protein
MDTPPLASRRLACGLALGLAAAVSAGCGKTKLPFAAETGPPPDPNATFTRVQALVFTPNCAVAGCHAALGPQQGMSLAASASYADTVGARSTERPDLNRIEPGDPDRSYLVKKIRGDADITGVRMPDGGSLTADQIQLVIDWVRRGAPRD